MKITIDLTSSKNEIDAIIAIAKRSNDVDDVSEPMALDASRALNCGLTLEMVTGALSFVTLVFKTGTAALAFLKAVREEVKARKAIVAVSDTVSGKSLGQIGPETAENAIEKILPR